MKLGHIPVIGVMRPCRFWNISTTMPVKYEAIMAISLALVDKCDAILVIGASAGANHERDLVKAKGLPVYHSLNEIPAAPSLCRST